MFPELKLDPGPLYDEAEQIEKRMKEALQSMRGPQTERSLADQSMIYG
jgi:predicted ATP-grasp superfamily ATP-dependent carboligase